jgi:competence protein ComEC
MARWTLGFLMGVVVLTHFSYLPKLQIAYSCIALSSISVILFRHTTSFLISLVITCLLGFSWALLVAHHRTQHYLPTVLEGKTLIVLGKVDSIPEYQRHQLRFDFLIKKIASQVSVHYPIRVRLSGYRYHPFTKRPRLQKGELWQLAIRLKRPRAFWTPGSFDYQAELFQQNVQAVGYIVDRVSPRLVEAASFYYFIDHLREKLAHHIKKSLQGYPLVGLISALTTGVRYEISDEQWQVMRRTGTNHLFAISGLHLAFISTIIYSITRFIYCRIPYAVLMVPASQIAAGLTALFAIFYAVLSGFALPVQRALVMLLVFLWASLFRRNITSGHAFYCALLIILVYAPFSVLSASFWLSFMAVAFILYRIVARLKPANAWQAWGQMQFGLSLGLIPFSLLFFHQIACLSFVANSIAIPVVGFIILPMALAGSLMTFIIPVGGNALLQLSERLLELIWQLLNYLATLQWTQYSASIATPWLLLTSFLGLLLLLAPQGIPSRFLSLFYLLPLFLWKAEGPKSGEIWFSLLDVGQGLATVIRTQHHNLVYDTGPSRAIDTGRAVLLPFLQELDIKKLDMLMVSHADNDHIGGSYSLLQQLPVDQIVSSSPEKFLPHRAKFCQEKTSWQWDEVTFEVLYPAANQVYSGNNSSCVLKVSNQKHSILLTGDIEKEGEAYLVNQVADRLASTILIVPHHGSKTSSSIEFLNKVRPAIALFPTGYHNQFKFPHKVVLNRYKRLKSIIYDTAMDGAISLKSDPVTNVIQVETYQQKHHRFWQG